MLELSTQNPGIFPSSVNMDILIKKNQLYKVTFTHNDLKPVVFDDLVDLNEAFKKYCSSTYHITIKEEE